MSTPADFTLGTIQGFMTVDHRVPSGYIVLEPHGCENCTRTFVRSLGSRVKYCQACQARMLLPVEDSEYRELLPREVEMRHSNHLPHYDDSLIPERKLVRKYSAPVWAEPLKMRLAAELMTYREMLAITKHCSVESLTHSIRAAGIKLAHVASVWPRPSIGVAPRLYRILDWREAALLGIEC
jgi:hypothetical protein